MKLVIFLAFFTANFSHANVNCLTLDGESKIAIVEFQNSAQSPRLDYFEKQNGIYSLKFQENVSVEDLLAPKTDPSQSTIEVTGSKSQLQISVTSEIFKKQSAQFKLNGKSVAFSCDIEN